MTKANRIIFFAAAAFFVAHQVSQKLLGWAVPWADNYLDCLVCAPLLLTAFQYEQRRLWGERQLSPAKIVLVITLLILVSEVVFPRLSDQFTADWLDVVAITAGGWIYALASHDVPAPQPAAAAKHI